MQSDDDDISIRPLSLDDYESVKPFLVKNFYPAEPLSQCVGYLGVNEKVQIPLIQHGISLIAEDRKSGRILGVIIAGMQYPNDLEDHQGIVETLKPEAIRTMMKFLMKLELEANVYEKYKVNKSIYLHIINVEPSMRGRGLGRRMVNTLLDCGRTKGFPLMVAYCTSFYSARLLKEMGWECAHFHAYKDYIDDDKGCVVFQPPEPHKECHVMVTRL